MSPVRPYRGVSADERRAERRRQLLDAALAVIERSGVASTTLNAVCAEAALSKRYFYESFTDLDALLSEVLDGLFTTVRGRIRTALDAAGRGPRQRARAAIDALVDVLASDARLARLYVEAPGHPVLNARRQRAFHEFAELLGREVYGLADPGPAQHAAFLLFVSGTTQVVVSWLEGSVELDRAQLVDLLASLRTDHLATSATAVRR